MFREALRLNNVLAPGWPTRPLADKAPRSTTTGPQTEETRWAGSNKNGESKNKVDLRMQPKCSPACICNPLEAR